MDQTSRKTQRNIGLLKNQNLNKTKNPFWNSQNGFFDLLQYA